VKRVAVRYRVRIGAGGESLISSAGGAMLLQIAAVSGLASDLSHGLAAWRLARSVMAAGEPAPREPVGIMYAEEM
jgi:hypothetical protein